MHNTSGRGISFQLALHAAIVNPLRRILDLPVKVHDVHTTYHQHKVASSLSKQHILA